MNPNAAIEKVYRFTLNYKLLPTNRAESAGRGRLRSWRLKSLCCRPNPIYLEQWMVKGGKV
ncbi:hypothetical protein F511_04577 [Dorcoceras hygrometricum]|uniref:Uncharacterized protein n=1 Tax=Dorcoceras hygrometricum TaxID=472368 RepID=A0A2Z7B1A8_9LAMI|nr:hypothetical protein F511_04577 [Dorcoceras hygrometricum]